MLRVRAQIRRLSEGKIEGASEARCPLVPIDNESPLFCSACGVSEVQFVCAGCKSAHYCGEQCQKAGWKGHKLLCSTISSLSRERGEKIDEMCSFISHVTPKVHQKLVQLVGERCIIQCKIGGRDEEGLWDTGAQVSLVSLNWLSSFADPPEVNSLESLIGANITLSGASGKSIPYVGFVYLPVQLKGQDEALDVPFLVTDSDLSSPIIGYNVIKAVAEEKKKDPTFFK